jgi:DNA-binding transcriptional LysR family regulator
MSWNPDRDGTAMLDLKDLRCFVTVYETRGFARAADALNTAQSNVSVRVLRLERAVGAPLFERRHRSIEPTQKGDLLYRHAKRVFAELEDLETSLKPRQAG